MLVVYLPGKERQIVSSTEELFRHINNIYIFIDVQIYGIMGFTGVYILIRRDRAMTHTCARRHIC